MNVSFIQKEFNESLRKKLVLVKKIWTWTFCYRDSHAMNIYNLIFSHSNAKFIIGLSTGGCEEHMIKETVITKIL